MMIIEPCVKFKNNSLKKQVWHILTEVWEVSVELMRGNTIAASYEIVDIMVACRTLLMILGWDNRNCDIFAQRVHEKNENRGYHTKGA